MNKVIPLTAAEGLTAAEEKFGRVVATLVTEQGEWSIHYKGSDMGLDYELSLDGGLVGLFGRAHHAQVLVSALIDIKRSQNPRFMCSGWIDGK